MTFVLQIYPVSQSTAEIASLFSQISAVFDAFIDACYDIVFLSWEKYAFFHEQTVNFGGFTTRITWITDVFVVK